MKRVFKKIAGVFTPTKSKLIINGRVAIDEKGVAADRIIIKG